MPSVAQEAPAVQSTKKRRREDNRILTTTPSPNHHLHQTQFAFNGDHVNTPHNIFAEKAALVDNGGLLHQHLAPCVRKVIPLPLPKRQRTWADTENAVLAASVSPSHIPYDRNAQSPQPQRPHHSQRPRSPLSSERSLPRHPAPIAPSTGASSSSTGASSSALTTRCHICSRKPTKKSDFDSFADCQGCGQRTCYVCIRECLGWGVAQQLHPPLTIHENPDNDTSFVMPDADAETAGTVETSGGDGRGTTTDQRHDKLRGWAQGGHRQMVCSTCCVERGADGDVVCLGCLPFVEG